MTRSFMLHQSSKALEKLNFSICDKSGVSIDIFMSVHMASLKLCSCSCFDKIMLTKASFTIDSAYGHC